MIVSPFIKILIVDSLVENQSLLKQMLQEIKVEIHTAHSGAEALEFISQHEYGLILLDLQLQDVDGFAVASQIHGNKDSRYIPIIFINAAIEDQQKLLQGYESGGSDFLFKPVDANLLRCKVRVFLELEQQRRSAQILATQHQLLLNLTGEGFIGLNSSGRISYLNPAAEKLLGASAALLTGTHIERYVTNPDQQDGYWENSPIHKTLTSCQPFKDDNSQFRRFDGQTFAASYTCNCIPRQATDLDSVGVIIFQDITDRKTIEQQLQDLAHYDPLTGLANRRMLQKFLEMEMMRAQRHKLKTTALLFMDLDNFKNINDVNGHGVGDQLLQSVGTRLRACVRSEDMVARLGGDEFAVVLVELSDPENAAKVAQKILEEVTVPHLLNGVEISTSISIGIAIFPESGRTCDEIIKAADMAMYHAKQIGKNTYHFFEPTMQKLAIERMELEKDLRASLEEDQFSVHYQPQVEVATGMIVGLEALLRWFHPQRGSVSPGLFVPIAEKCGAIGQLGEWILKAACKQNTIWNKKFGASLRMTVAVNVSINQLKYRTFLSSVDQILEETGLQPHNLEIELTESTVMDDPETAIPLLNYIHDLGVRIAIDDFGTGYSSLSYLRRLPLDVLKIDLSFVKNIGKNSHDETIIKTIISLAHNLGMEVTAEGVETAEHVAFLKEYQCDFMQGYYFSKPGPAEEIEKLFQIKNSF